MKPLTQITPSRFGATLLLAVLVMSPELPILGQVIGFSSGSDGSYGPLSVVSDTTLPLPENGIIHATTVHIAAGTTLKFGKNSRNTPVYLLATGPITVEGTIDLQGGQGNLNGTPGVGGPGGFDGGYGASVDVPPGPGQGPGGGKDVPGWVYGGGSAAHRTDPSGDVNPPYFGPKYGNSLLIPPTGGSGGGGGLGVGGGGGGGAITMASNERITISRSGLIDARGGPNQPRGNRDGYGSGGSVRLVAPSVQGTGTLQVMGGGMEPTHARGGDGYIRVDALDRGALSLDYRGGPPSFGTLMLAIPTPSPQLDIVEVHGNPIALGSGPVTFVLPLNTSPDTTVKVAAKGFNALLPLRLELTPDNGSKVVYTATVDNKAVNPAEHLFKVKMPVNVRVTVHLFGGSNLPPAL